MKKLFLTAIMLGGFLTGVNAQVAITTPQMSENVGAQPVQKGNWIVGGSVGSIGYSFEGKTFNVNVMPTAGYFISDGVAVGLELGAGYQSVKNGDDDWTYAVAPFIRYYLPQGARPNGRFFLHGNVGLDGGNNGKDTSFAFKANGGYAHFVSKNVALEASAGYNYSKARASNAVKQDGLGVAVGFQIYLPGKAK